MAAAAAAYHARQIAQAIEAHGEQRVEAVLDAALALETHIDTFKDLRRERYPEYLDERADPTGHDPFRARFEILPGEAAVATEVTELKRAPIPASPERDLLWFIAQYAPELEDWERDIFLAVREESFYFYPVFACQIMNEGWASYWHHQIMNSLDLPQEIHMEFLVRHNQVVSPHPAGINPYHLGFKIWHDIERRFDEPTQAELEDPKLWVRRVAG